MRVPRGGVRVRARAQSPGSALPEAGEVLERCAGQCWSPVATRQASTLSAFLLPPLPRATNPNSPLRAGREGLGRFGGVPPGASRRAKRGDLRLCAVCVPGGATPKIKIAK